MIRKSLLIMLFMAVAVYASAQSLADARKLTENEQFEAATEVYKKLISVEPSNANNYYYYGENLLLSDKHDSATILFTKGKSLDASNQLNQIGLAKVKLDLYNLANVTAAMKNKEGEMKEIGDYMKTIDPLKDGGVEMENAAKRLEQASKELSQMGNDLDKATNEVSSAKGMIAEATSKAPKNSIVFLEAADALVSYSSKDLEKAKEYLATAEKLDPKNTEVKILYGDIYTEENNGTLAADYYNQALNLDAKSVRSIVNKGRLYKRTNNFEGAAAEFERAISIDASYAPAHRELGETYFKQGKLEKAKAEYRTYLDLSKNNCGARIRYASFLYLGKDYRGAIDELNQLQTCDPDNMTRLRVTAYSSYELKDSANAMTAVEKLFSKINKEKITALDLEYRGKIYAMSKLDSVGLIYLKQAYDKDPQKSDLLNDIFNAYFKTKKYQEAIDVMNQKISMGKDVKAVDYFNLGRSYYFSKNYSMADSSFRKLNELSPKYSTGFLWRAKANTQIDSTSKLGLAKPFYENYVALVEEDSVTTGKYKPSNIGGYIEALNYLSSFALLQEKNNSKTLDLLRKKITFPLEAEDRKTTEENIKQLSGK